jgi:hypothetical protein
VVAVIESGARPVVDLLWERWRPDRQQSFVSSGIGSDDAGARVLKLQASYPRAVRTPTTAIRRSWPLLRSSASPAVHRSPRAARVGLWIEPTYNRRRQRRLGKLTPVEYELVFTAQAAALAA